MHDKNGKLLTVGDTVTITATVKNIFPSPGFCNMEVELVEPMPNEKGEPASKSTFHVNCKQAEKAN